MPIRKPIRMATARTDRQSGSPEQDRLPLGPWNDSTLQLEPGGGTPTEPYRFVTLVDQRFVPGLLALVASMVDNAGIPFRFTVIELEPLTLRSRAAVEALGVEVEWIGRRELGDFGTAGLKTDQPRMRPNFHKPLIWALPYDETCLYLDCDVLCLGPLRGINAFPSLSVVVQQSSIGKGPDHDEAYKPSGRYPFNAGVMVFRPDAAIYRELQVWARSYAGQRLKYGDQVIHNDYFAHVRPNDVHWLSPEWNMSTWVSQRFPELCDLSKVRLLHFAHAAKPWFGPPSHDWMAGYWRLWWRYYGKSVR